MYFSKKKKNKFTFYPTKRNLNYLILIPSNDLKPTPMELLKIQIFIFFTDSFFVFSIRVLLLRSKLLFRINCRSIVIGLDDPLKYI